MNCSKTQSSPSIVHQALSQPAWWTWLLILACGCRSISPQERTAAIPILAWIGPPAEQTTPQRYRELAQAGFTVSFSSFPNTDAMERALDVSQAAGVQLMISCPELQRDPEATVRRFMNHPAVAGYYLRDEPNAADFKELGNWARRIRSVDEAHPCYLNLFPTYASAAQLGTPTYREHVNRFLDEVPVQVLSFDHYPIVGDQLRADWYENLEIIAEAAKRSQKPFWAFALSVAHDPYPVATVDGLRLQVFSDLVYGARAIQYFTYWTPQSSTWNFHQAPIETNGAQTEVYARVRQVNSEIQRLAPIFAHAQVVDVAHLGSSLPRGTHRYQPVEPVAAIDTEGQGVVVSHLRSRSHEFLAVVNRELKASTRLQIRFSGNARVKAIDKQGKPRNVSSAGFTEMVDPGDIRVFSWPR